MKEFTKDLDIQGRKWRVGLVPAEVGVWIFMQLSADARCADFEIYTKIKDFLFSQIAVYVDTGTGLVPKSIYAKGTWLAPELDLVHDPSLVNALFFAALDFNISPFAQSAQATP